MATAPVKPSPSWVFQSTLTALRASSDRVTVKVAVLPPATSSTTASASETEKVSAASSLSSMVTVASAILRLPSGVSNSDTLKVSVASSMASSTVLTEMLASVFPGAKLTAPLACS